MTINALIAALALLIGLLAILVVGLLRSHAEILRALHGMGIDLGADTAEGRSLPRLDEIPGRVPGGTPHEIVGVDPSGGSRSLALVGTGRTTLLAFLSSGCLTCRPMWHALGEPGAPIPTAPRVVVVTKGPHEESGASVSARAPSSVVTVMSSEAWEGFAVPGSPYFVLLDEDGEILGEGTAGTWERVIELLTESTNDAAASSGRAPRRARDRLEHVEGALRAAGIEAGHPSLYPVVTNAGETAEEGIRTE